jgi:hypothetical protein
MSGRGRSSSDRPRVGSGSRRRWPTTAPSGRRPSRAATGPSALTCARLPPDSIRWDRLERACDGNEGADARQRSLAHAFRPACWGASRPLIDNAEELPRKRWLDTRTANATSLRRSVSACLPRHERRVSAIVARTGISSAQLFVGVCDVQSVGLLQNVLGGAVDAVAIPYVRQLGSGSNGGVSGSRS